ncbi:hypothetical protein [uncultured Piscinibacter sp.]|uniref:hypothetical protein n=1 Tax=uncultured Piscinibacter sp. TaxID=1131835 RepID=UPI0026127662|nr:hypothetical protein [uncultured Piscinibacter sp.]
MDTTRTPATRPGAETLPAQIAKAALRRLVLDRLEPTPENCARAYAQEAGEPAPAASEGAALAALIGKLVRGVERGGRHWTAARRKDSLQRVLEGSRGDAKRLQQRLAQLAASWESDTPDAGVETEPAPLEGLETPPQSAGGTPIALALADERPWGRVVGTLGETTRKALPPDDAAAPLSQALAGLVQRIGREGASTPLAEELETLCRRAGICGTATTLSTSWVRCARSSPPA